MFHASRAASIMPLDYPDDRSLEAHRQVMFSKLHLPLHGAAGIERNRVDADALPQGQVVAKQLLVADVESRSVEFEVGDE